jgi:two-component system, sensor histidine kinase and response regulator
MALCLVRDVTARKEAEKKLKLLARTLDRIDECVSICDPDDRVIYVNRAFLNTYGYTERDVLGESISIVRSPLNSPEVTRGILPATLSGGWRGELWNRQKDNTDFLILLSTAAVLDEAGTLVATVGVARDITERKRAEEELRSAKEHAEAATRAKSEFLATMSHEIRTPLNAVLGYVQLLQETQLTSEQVAYLSIIQQSGRLLASTVNDILDFTKISTGMLRLEQLPCNLLELLDNVSRTATVAPKIRSGEIEFHQRIAENVPPYIVTDTTRLAQVLNNLLSNAIKFTERGSVTYGVSRSGGYLEFFVEDTGIGIPADRQSAVFLPLVQADSSTTRRFGGTGLGLAISKSLVDLMGGALGLESTLGRGSRFYFSHPLVMADSAAVERPVSASASRRPEHPLRILVAEDNPVNQRLLATMLRKLGHEDVTVVADGEQAVRACLERQYDVIFMDMRMPVLDGYDAAGRIRDHERHVLPRRKTRIVAVTASALADDQERCLAAGCDTYLAKPVSMADVEKTLRLDVATRKQGP